MACNPCTGIVTMRDDSGIGNAGCLTCIGTVGCLPVPCLAEFHKPEGQADGRQLGGNKGQLGGLVSMDCHLFGLLITLTKGFF
jgi:hypothetical protein